VKQRHLRADDDLTDDIVVVRGGALEAEVLRVDATRYFSIYGTYGISVFAAREITVDELAQEPPLVRFEVLSLLRVGNLRAAQLRLVPTGRNRRHFTVAWDNLEDGVTQLVGCEHEARENPYHDG
jgi:hypothetical protein